MIDFSKLIELNQRVDGETAKLLMKFVGKALQSGDINEFVKRALQRAMSEDIEVVDPSEGPRR